MEFLEFYQLSKFWIYVFLEICHVHSGFCSKSKWQVLVRLIINVSCRFYFGGTSGFCKGYEHQKQISSSVLYVFLIISAGRRSASGQLPPQSGLLLILKY